jgi:mannosyltransferase
MSAITEAPADLTATSDDWFIRDFTFPLPGFIRRLPAWARTSLILFILCLASAYIRTRVIGQQFWEDEGITVGISSHSFGSIPGIMKLDGSPPLFYMMLHVWMQLVGNGQAATHWLSGISALLTIPISYWGVLRIAGKRAALMTATLMAFSAFLDYYAQETRMYAFMTLLGLIGTIGFIRGFVFRERRYVIMFSLAEAAMLYTHNWALFYGAAGVVSLIILYYISGPEIRENLIKDAVYAYLGAAILFAPWVPTFITQALHTAAPWDTAPRFGAPIQIALNVYGGASVAMLSVIAAGLGYARLFTKAERNTIPAKVGLMLICLVILTLAFGWWASQVTPAWNPRYFAPIIAPLMMLTAIGMSRVGLVGAIAMLFILIFLCRPGAFETRYKSDMQDIGGEMAGLVHKGDLVIVGQPEETALAYYYLPGGLKWANTIGPVADPTYMNWTNAMNRYLRATPSKVLPPMINALKPGQQLLYIRSLTEGTAGWKAQWTAEIRLRAAQWGAIIQHDLSDGQLIQERWAPHNYRGACCVANSAVLYKKA